MNAPTAWSECCRSVTRPIIEACAVVPVLAGPAALTQEISRRLPDWPFREVLCRGGWYRLGGVIGAAGERISDQLEAWAEAELEKRDGDLAALLDDFADTGYRATHFVGRTHYFVAPAGSGATDFVQLEVEALQETLAHPLFDVAADGRAPPSTLDELLDARGAAHAGAPIGPPVYGFRRLTHIGDLLGRMRAQSLDPPPVHRFVADWETSSAGRATSFCNQWVIAVREHLDRYRQPIVRAQPVPARNGPPPAFPARQGTSGLALSDALNAFDRQAGFPMAWYFHRLTTRAVPHWVAVSVAEDAAAGFSYLPERDLVVVRNWLHKAYGF